MIELFRDNFYWIDFTIGGAMPIAAFILYRFGRIDKFQLCLFWIGVALGLTWEVPMSCLTTFSKSIPVHYFVRPMPVNFIVWIILHSFWDGGLFVLGVWIVKWICRDPHFERFRPCELAALLLWGQASELWVELTSTFAGGWVYITYWWNPLLFIFNGHDITILPQLIWLVAPIVFYLVALWLKPRLFLTQYVSKGQEK
jgi:hypothetical protein